MFKNSDKLPCTTGTLSQAFHWPAKDYHILHFSSWSSQCGPKVAKGPTACSQGNEDEKQIPHWEMRKQTLFPISYIDVLFRDLPVWIHRWKLGQLLCQSHRLDLPLTNYSPTHPGVWLVKQMGGIRTMWRTSLSSTRTDQNWLSICKWVLI